MRKPGAAWLAEIFTGLTTQTSSLPTDPGLHTHQILGNLSDGFKHDSVR